MAERPLLVLPAGTHVVTRVAARMAGGNLRPRGAVGVVVKAPADARHTYRVRFPDGAEASLRRADLAIRRHEAEAPDPTEHVADVDWDRYVIYRCVVGSRAYGLAEEGSDTDRRGIYLPPAELHWSLYGVPQQVQNEARQECYWELQKFITFALKANPNVLECLYTPLVETATPLAEELLAMRAAFLSKLVYQTYSGYVMSQFKKLEADLGNRGALKWKHVMHLIRLLLAGIDVLRDGELRARVEEHRESLLAIRRGETPWEEIDAWRLALHREMDAAFQATRLPERPDYERVNAFLIRARRFAAEDTWT